MMGSSIWEGASAAPAAASWADVMLRRVVTNEADVADHANEDYRPLLSSPQLVAEVQSLRAGSRRAERLICRYLADLADRLREGQWHGLSCFSNELEVARFFLRMSERDTRERVRVGRALRKLPQIERAFIAGSICYSRVRELTRVARPDTESDWLRISQQLDMRELEHRVAAARRRAQHAGIAAQPVDEAPSQPPAAGRVANEQSELSSAVAPERSEQPGETWRSSNPEEVAVHADEGHSSLDEVTDSESGSSALPPSTRAQQERTPVSPAPFAEAASERTGAAVGSREGVPGSSRSGANGSRVEWLSEGRVRLSFELGAEVWGMLEREMGRLHSRSGGLSEAEALERVLHDALAALAAEHVASRDGQGQIGSRAEQAVEPEVPVARAADDRAGTVSAPHDERSGSRWGAVASSSQKDDAFASAAAEVGSCGCKEGIHAGPERPRHGERGRARRGPSEREKESPARGGAGACTGERASADADDDSLRRNARRLLRLIGELGGWTFEELLERSGLRVQDVSSALMWLELQGRIHLRNSLWYDPVYR